MVGDCDVIWVDDEIKEEWGVTLEEELRKRGFRSAQVATFKNASDILVFVASPVTQPKLIIFDALYEGAKISAREVLEVIARATPRIPIIIYSGAPEIVQTDTLTSFPNVVAYVAKPDLEELVEAVCNALSWEWPRILHLSDLHFGWGHEHGEAGSRESLLDAFVPEVEGWLGEARPNLIVVSGDLTSQGSRDEFVSARSFLGTLADALGVGREAVLVVPGNHDVQLAEKFSYNNYQEHFVEKFYSDIAGADSWHLDDDPPREGLSQDSIAWVRRVGGVRSVFVGLNSVTVSDRLRRKIRKYGRGTIGKVPTPQLVQLGGRLQLEEDKNLRIAVLHHQLFPVPSRRSEIDEIAVEVDDNRVVLGEATLLNWLGEHQVQIVLHGHSHYPAARTVITHYAGRWEQSGMPIHIIAGGTTGARGVAVAFPEHQYSMINVKEVAGNLTASVQCRLLPRDGTGWRGGEGMNAAFPLEVRR